MSEDFDLADVPPNFWNSDAAKRWLKVSKDATDDEWAELLTKMAWPQVARAEEWITHPLAQRWMQKGRSSPAHVQIHTAGDVLGERFVVLAIHAMRIQQDIVPEDQQWGTRALVALGSRATPYLWTMQCKALAESLEVPRHVVSRSVLPGPLMWWTWQTGYAAGEGTLDGMVLADGAEGIAIYAFGADRNEGFVRATGIRYGSTWPDDYDADDDRGAVLGMLAFLNSPYIPQRRERPSRSERRETQRAGHLVDDDVVFVELRTPQLVHRVDSDSEPGAVDWQHRWLVRGHNRAQWYPSEAAHHLIYIAPYMKGPEDKPVLEHAYRVKR